MKKSRPDGWRTVTPRIVTGDVTGVVGFLKAVFDARGEVRAGVPADMPYGDRRATVRDPWGNVWQIATHRGDR